MQVLRNGKCRSRYQALGGQIRHARVTTVLPAYSTLQAGVHYQGVSGPLENSGHYFPVDACNACNFAHLDLALCACVQEALCKGPHDTEDCRCVDDAHMS